MSLTPSQQRAMMERAWEALPCVDPLKPVQWHFTFSEGLARADGGQSVVYYDRYHAVAWVPEAFLLDVETP